MKFFDREAVWLKKGYFIQVENEYFQIIHTEWTHFEVDLLTLTGGVAPLAIGATQGPFLIPQLLSKYYSTIVQVFFAPEPIRVNTRVTGIAPAGNVDAIEERSVRLRYFNPRGQPRNRDPTYDAQGYSDIHVSQREDPAEDWPLWLMHNDDPAFSMENVTGLALQNVNVHFWLRHYALKEFGTDRPKDANYVTPIPYSRSSIADFSDKPKIHAF